MIGRLHDGTGVFPDNPKQECDWYERAAEVGYGPAMHNLGLCFRFGSGREQDEERAMALRAMAANHGSLNAMFGMANLDTREGPDYRHWMNKAAEHGSRYAMVDLWLSNYEDDARKHGMTFGDLLCVSWYILILDNDTTACD